ncbi:alpha/beta hydrolase [Niveispirillum fermenti]|uniref:alpha/beta hydrolase n=1 Tax=Niveispirillum fermenti TaxID=1233113 RepID=UPI003A8A2335
MAYVLFPLLLWIAYALWFRLRQDTLLFRPSARATPLADAGLGDFQPVWAQTADGLLLEGSLRPADGLTKPTILLLHGSRGQAADRADRARVLADAGFGVLLAGYRGYAGNPGRPGGNALMLDARAWADLLVTRGISGGRLVLYGQEMGAVPAAMLAGERATAALVLEAPCPSMAGRMGRRFPLLPVQALLRHRLSVTGLLPMVRAPTLILGSADAELGKPAAAPLTIVPMPSGHEDGELPPDQCRALLAFLGGEAARTRARPTLEQKTPAAGGRAVAIRRPDSPGPAG